MNLTKLFAVSLSCWCNGLIYGMINTFGIIYDNLVGKDIGSKSSLKNSIVGALPNGIFFMTSILANMVMQRIGRVKTALIGTTLCTVGLVVTALFPNSIIVLYVCVGLIVGLGNSLIYVPVMNILLCHFEKNIGTINGIVASGTAIFTIILPHVIRPIINNLGLSYLFGFQACAYLLIYACLPVLRQTPNKKINLIEKLNTKLCPSSTSEKFKLLDVLNVYQYKMYVIGYLSLRIGYGTTYLYLVRYTVESHTTYKGDILVSALGLGSIIGRLVFGKISDYKGFNRVIIHQFASMIGGICLLFIPILIQYKYYMMILSTILGVALGILSSFIMPICRDLLGPKKASSGMSFAMTVMSIPIIIGPIISGTIRDNSGSYSTVFNINSIWLIITALFTTFAHMKHENK
ncbi:hypothetical protein A3Q56_00236 [Intoshia linei]|uniref:Major facilitator superfamily (MFS) profile domain-containing protein n=1 Tax=Intoshia linei TaxID=1819745 RepID=A0A177BCE2_9BILA|nr:hypothetical protein A3Q56_00236 [Intoshia linei]